MALASMATRLTTGRYSLPPFAALETDWPFSSETIRSREWMKREIWGQITMLELKQNRKNLEKVGQNGVNKQCLQIIFIMYLWMYLFMKSKGSRQVC